MYIGELITPTHFTVFDGGKWEEWKGDPVSKIKLDNMSYEKVHKTKQVAIGYNNIYLQHLHSLAFSYSIGTPRGGFARWDCVNGWTTTLEDIETMNDGV